MSWIKQGMTGTPTLDVALSPFPSGGSSIRRIGAPADPGRVDRDMSSARTGRR